MGGHDHGHHNAPYIVPKPEIYNNQVEKISELRNYQNELAKRGLKDPWIRNEVWRYNQKVWGNPRLRMIKFIFTGFPLGAACAAATIAYEEYFEVYKDHRHDEHAHH
ncbi:NADH dehydrogenase [ubiquinone] 1 beta subcomplex subunit 3 [Contarinia nasturtii]|uniref:NADH dehydrogenase [ubiquinone] 1 beta subcomplex subunit 3 n=1 Tax=Contarinia nasturtii TaxID=265458 RepID=UPI0012D382FB|nr:NADH dehydrogenase [ubiquinone] 1 beta subcomplex subunit 3 [Contarinia nasturtii]XP_031616731.1 NADH dehydrogenase [ubiquinone] 1 beta subcomplex subunit 3 [Contarinia nasturtii]